MSNFGGDPVTQLIVNVHQMKFIPQCMYLPLISTGWMHHAVRQLSLSATVCPYQPKATARIKVSNTAELLYKLTNQDTVAIHNILLAITRHPLPTPIKRRVYTGIEFCVRNKAVNVFSVTMQ